MRRERPWSEREAMNAMALCSPYHGDLPVDGKHRRVQDEWSGPPPAPRWVWEWVDNVEHTQDDG